MNNDIIILDFQFISNFYSYIGHQQKSLAYHFIYNIMDFLIFQFISCYLKNMIFK